jgi:hypothetical protein
MSSLNEHARTGHSSPEGSFAVSNILGLPFHDIEYMYETIVSPIFVENAVKNSLRR